MKENILITGGASFIGCHLIKRLSKEDCHISILDNRNLRQEIMNFLGNGILERISFYKEDLRNSSILSDIIKREKIDTCIHLAAEINLHKSISRLDLIDVNIKGTFNLLEACCEYGVKNFVFASSAAVYGESKRLPISEDQPLNPLSLYGSSKVAGEALVDSYRNLKKIRNAVSLRFFNVFGEFQNADYAGVITKFAMRLSKGLSPIIYGNGTQTRDFVFVDDVVTSILLAIERGEKVDLLDVFNIGTGVPLTLNDLAEKLIDFFSLSSSLEPVHCEANKDDIVHSYADTTKSRKILRFSASVEFDKRLKEMILAIH